MPRAATPYVKKRVAPRTQSGFAIGRSIQRKTVDTREKPSIYGYLQRSMLVVRSCGNRCVLVRILLRLLARYASESGAGSAAGGDFFFFFDGVMGLNVVVENLDELGDDLVAFQRGEESTVH